MGLQVKRVRTRPDGRLEIARVELPDVAERRVFLHGRGVGDYGAVARPEKETVYLYRVELPRDAVVDRMRCFVAQFGAAARTVRMGLYDQADPQDPSGAPANLLGQTTSAGTDVPDESFVELPLQAAVVVAASGFHWLAIVVDDPPAQPTSLLRLASTVGSFAPGFLPMRELATTGDSLPASAAGSANGSGAILFVSAMEKV